MANCCVREPIYPRPRHPVPTFDPNGAVKLSYFSLPSTRSRAWRGPGLGRGGSFHLLPFLHTRSYPLTFAKILVRRVSHGHAHARAHIDSQFSAQDPHPRRPCTPKSVLPRELAEEPGVHALSADRVLLARCARHRHGGQARGQPWLSVRRRRLASGRGAWTWAGQGERVMVGRRRGSASDTGGVTIDSSGCGYFCSRQQSRWGSTEYGRRRDLDFRLCMHATCVGLDWISSSRWDW